MPMRPLSPACQRATRSACLYSLARGAFAPNCCIPCAEQMGMTPEAAEQALVNVEMGTRAQLTVLANARTLTLTPLATGRVRQCAAIGSCRPSSGTYFSRDLRGSVDETSSPSLRATLG